MSPFVFERRGRAPGTIAALAAIYAALLAARVELSAANLRGDIYSAQAIIERLVFDIGNWPAS